MADIIQLLPDSVANQIAAGEVIQRPASIVKEMVENAIDAEATEIKVIVKDAGKTLVQVIDNGKGMSDTDARLSFERHATSKIRKANDLFALTTMGFRGEALASIAAVAQVNLKTKREEDELGTEISISASVVESQDPVSCPVGANFMIKNLFFNIPARRKFLKSDVTEFKHIITEFSRIALANPQIELLLYHNNVEIYNLPASNVRQRIVHMMGKSINSKLVTVESDTTIVKITGFVGKPEFARKSSGEQYFFINNRFMKHPYFHRAVLNAFDQLIPADEIPSYFLYFEADPAGIDVNIHPTKTEIKFESEQAFFQIIQAAVKEALGKFNEMPSLDFNREGVLDIPILRSDTEIKQPGIRLNPNFNPFDNDEVSSPTRSTSSYTPPVNSKPHDAWENLYDGIERNTSFDAPMESQREPEQQTLMSEETTSGQPGFYQFKQKYILTQVKSGLMLIDQKRAHERILFEKYLDNLERKEPVSQRSLYPEKMELSNADYAILTELLDDLPSLGFEISDLGNNVIAVNACPADTSAEASTLVENLIQGYATTGADIKENAKEQLARSLAKASAIPYGKSLNTEEMRILFDKLFACSSPNYSPDGKLIISIIGLEELEKKFKS